VMQFDGFGELHEIRNEVEDRFGIVAAVWAHRRWIGLEDKTGAVWW
jgi:hypothetical protein